GEDNWSMDDVAIAVEDDSNLDFAWAPGAVIEQPTALQTSAWPQATGWIHVTSMDNGNGCTYADSVVITVGQEFTLSITPATTMCDVPGIQLSAVPSSGTNVNYLWSPNTAITSVSSATPTVTPTATTTYSATATSAEG